MATVKIAWDDAAIKLWMRDPAAQPARALDLLAGQITNEMKRLCPVSPVFPVYARPVAPGNTRYPGDLPLRPSGYLRSSIHAFRQDDGSIIIGPTADYAEYVNNGTVPHEIHSHGPWPLRNRATGQVFGRSVHHPGTTGAHFIERAAESINGMQVRT